MQVYVYLQQCLYSSQTIESALLSIYRRTDDVKGIPLYNGSLFSHKEINFVIPRERDITTVRKIRILYFCSFTISHSLPLPAPPSFYVSIYVDLCVCLSIYIYIYLFIYISIMMCVFDSKVCQGLVVNGKGVEERK